jgi:hypothetical protein
MDTSPLLFLHITAGAFGLASGFTALFVRKGERLHRLAGNVFFIAMLAMAATGAIMGALGSVAVNVVAGSITCYLVATSWVTVIRKEGEIGRFETYALFAALLISAGAWFWGMEAAASPTGNKDGIPAAVYYFFGTISAAAAVFDLTVILRRGLSGAQRIARHLWRMSFALLIASLSFFLGQAKFLPAWAREANLNMIPMIVVVLIMVYWLGRVLLTSWAKRQGEGAYSVAVASNADKAQTG